MPHYSYRNVNNAFQGLVRGFADGMVPTVLGPSRVGQVMTVVEPVIVTYQRPLERVLFNKARDANPFLHLYESLWMLAGRNEIAMLEYYAADFGKFVRDKDDPDHQNGAYGYRWRKAKINWDLDDTQPIEEAIPIVAPGLDRKFLGYFEDGEPYVDQIAILIDQFKRKPETRRAVLAMWNVEQDLLKIDTSVDVCCNLCCTFMIRTVDDAAPCEAMWATDTIAKPKARKYLDMTVFNRSNDLILGMLGANVVHFSFLQEYMANCIGVEVGVYNQISSNLHAYTERWKPAEWLAEYSTVYLCKEHHPDGISLRDYVGVGPDYACSVCGKTNVYVKGFSPENTYPEDRVQLVQDPATFDRECDGLVDGCWGPNMPEYLAQWHKRPLSEPFLQTVAMPMLVAFHLHKSRDYASALHWCARVQAADWSRAATQWITKRRDNYNKRIGGGE